MHASVSRATGLAQMSSCWCSGGSPLAQPCLTRQRRGARPTPSTWLRCAEEVLRAGVLNPRGALRQCFNIKVDGVQEKMYHWRRLLGRDIGKRASFDVGVLRWFSCTQCSGCARLMGCHLDGRYCRGLNLAHPDRHTTNNVPWSKPQLHRLPGTQRGFDICTRLTHPLQYLKVSGRRQLRRHGAPSGGRCVGAQG